MNTKTLVLALSAILTSFGTAYCQSETGGENLRVSTSELSEGLTSSLPQASADDAPWRHLYFKTNSVAWMLGVTNVTFEIECSKHWSVALPIYYCGWNYFSYKNKFRTLSAYPEVRYYCRAASTESLYFGVHAGMAYYNFTFGGSYRYQDHLEKTPAFGGGVTVGYRVPMGKSGHWSACFEVGAGLYHLKYDQILNEKPSNKIVKVVERNWFGVDNLSVTFAYALNLAKR
jgi:hypothetical protein